MIKKIVSICLAIFIIAILGIFILSQTNQNNTPSSNRQDQANNSTSSGQDSISLGHIANQNPQNTSSTNTSNTANSNTRANPLVNLTTSYTSSEVAKHNTRNDCWMIIINKVYNVTDYLSFHPGGVGAMLPYCGAEATRAFDTKDQGQPHSNQANSLLNNYFVGDLKT